eukprot:TRINITY_DN32521_c0_g1_i2.p1 TRINITY_DN32521_c0_g1~~TRINITY_DN32521_c0_g1_i2.p1  ORF type:complete len:1175 (+),score=212.14 TRINITY_DN32521_c0_g1_i2:164-3688(+)
MRSRRGRATFAEETLGLWRLDADLAATEAALQELEKEVALGTQIWHETRDEEASKGHAWPVGSSSRRFQAPVSFGESNALKPSLADPLVRANKPAYSFSREAARAQNVESCSRHALDDGQAAAEDAVRTSQNTPHGTAAPRSFTVPGESRWPSDAGGTTYRLRAKLHLVGGLEDLGFVFEKYSPPGVVAIASIVEGSAAGRWNEAQVEVGSAERQVAAGDILVELAGRKVRRVEDVDSALRAARQAAAPDVGEGDLPVGVWPIDVALRRRIGRGPPRSGEHMGCEKAQQHGLTPSPTRDSEQGRARPAEAGCRGGTSPSAASVRPPTAAALRYLRPGSQLGPAEDADAQVPTTLQSADDWQTRGEGRLPGRCCRATPVPLPAEILANVALAAASAGSAAAEQGRAAGKQRVSGGTFGSEQRFPAQLPEADDAPAPQKLCPSDKFLSTRSTSRSAVINPPRKTGKQTKMSKTDWDGVPSVAYVAGPGLRGVQGAWAALVRETLQRSETPFEEASTEAGSERSAAETSILSDWSEVTTNGTSEVPGPGAYSPDFNVVARRLSKGTPSFARYSARERKKPSEAEPDLPADDTVETSRPSARSPRCGLIAPLPSSRARAVTEKAAEDKAKATRPFYDPRWVAVDPAIATPQFAPVATGATETGRLEMPRKDAIAGPGTYDLPTLVPSGPAAIIAPLPTPKPSDARTDPLAETPGPATYESSVACTVVYPRSQALAFGPAVGHSMEFQKAPRYTTEYSALEPRWDSVLRRSMSAIILPVTRSVQLLPSALRAPEEPGPGAYDIERGDDLTKRIRGDMQIQRWLQPSHNMCEHEHAMFTGKQDSRALPSPEDDAPLRRRHPAAVIHPLSRSMPSLRPQEEDNWKFYDLPGPPEPEGLADFSRRLDFEDFQDAEARWLAAERRGERSRKPSNMLSYSLPGLDTTMARAPAHDFSKAPERPQEDEDNGLDSPREGDVLVLGMEAERNLFHPRLLTTVDMAKQLGRGSSCPPRPSSAEQDDFEDLLMLDPEPPKKHVPMFVDMARSTARASEPEFSANAWAVGDNGATYTYHTTQSQRARNPEEELALDTQPGERLLRPRSVECDFTRALGRPGVDHRVAAGHGESVDLDQEQILTYWQPRFQNPRRRSRSPAVRGAEDVVEPDPPLADPLASQATLAAEVGS